MAQKIVSYSGETLKPYTGGGSSSEGSYENGGEQKIVSYSGKTLKPYSSGTSLYKYAESLEQDTNQFIRMANRDNSEERGFNAADYFEERKKQAEALKIRAADLTRQVETDLNYDPEAYQPLIDYLSNFDTMVDDVLSSYKPSLDAREGMRAYEDEFIAAQERNERLKGLNKQVMFGADSTSPGYGMLERFYQYDTDNSYRGVTDNWTDKERYTLGQLQKEDPAKARDYATQVNNYYNAQSTEATRENIRQNAVANKGKSTAAALLASTFTAPGELADRLAENMARGTTTEKRYVTPTDYAQEITGAISQDLNQKHGTFDADEARRIRAELQNNVQSLVDNTGSGMNVATGKTGEFVYDMLDDKGRGDLYQVGYSIAQNALSRYTLGAMGGEAAVLANYFMNAATSGIDDARRAGASGNQAMLSGIVKGALEVATEVAPLDRLFKMGSAVTWGELFKNLGMEALLEAIGEGSNTALGYLADQKILGDASEYNRMVQEYVNQGMTEAQAKQRAFRDAAMNTAYDALTGAISGIVSGGTETVGKTAQANLAYRNVDPRTLVDMGMGTAEGSKAYTMAQQMQEQLDNDHKISGNQKRVLAQNIQLQKPAQEKTETETGETASTFSRATEQPKVSKDGRAIQISTDNPVDVLDFASMDNGVATVQLNDGETAAYDDIAFKDQQQANQFYAVRSLPGLDTESANNLLHTIQDADAGKDIDSVVGIREAYAMGYYNQSESNLAKGDAAALTPELRKAVFDIGRQQNQAQEKIQPKVKAVTAKPTQGYKKITVEGKITKLDKKRKAEMAYVDTIADNFAGTAVHVYESYVSADGKRYFRDNNGVKHKAPNGKYINGEIWLDINSGDNGEGMMLNTFAHDMYHHIEKFNKEKANELASFVSRELGIENVEAAVQAQIDKARAAGYGEDYFKKQGMTDIQATNEVYARAMSDFVADSLETMFTRGNPAEAISKLKTENRGLFDEIKSFIDKWVSKLKKFYQDKTISMEGEIVSQLKNFEELQQLFMEAMQGAGENYRAAPENAEPAVEPEFGDLTEAFSLRNEKPLTDREILAQIDPSKRNETERYFLGQYQDRLKEISEEEPRLAAIKKQMESLDPKKDKAKLSELRIEAGKIQRNVTYLKKKVRESEGFDMFKRMAREERNNRSVQKYKEEQKQKIDQMQEEQRILRNELTGTVSMVNSMEDEFVKLAKDYEAKKIDLKTMEEKYLNAGKKYNKDTEMWEREFTRLMGVYDSLSGKYKNAQNKIERLEATIIRQRQTAKDRVAGRKRTEMIHKIQRKVNDLNNLLLHGTKHRNVPEGMQAAVAELLKSINMETKDIIQRVDTYEATLKRYTEKIARASSEAEVERLIEQRNRYAAKGDQFGNKMAELQKAYEQIQKDKIPELEMDAGIYEHLMTLFVLVGDTPLGQMNADQMNAVNEVLNITTTTIRNANKMFKETQRAGVEENSKSAMTEIRTIGGGAKKRTEVREEIEKFGWNNLKPVQAFEAIGSSVLNHLFKNLRSGEDTLAVDLQEGKNFFKNQWKKHNGDSWDTEKKWKFTSTSGKSFELDLNQIMSLYALAKRDQARDHLRVGGFTFDSQYKVKDEVKFGPVKIKAEVKNTDASAYNLSDEILGEIIGKLTADQRAFVDSMQDYLSDNMAAKGNEISLKKYGIRLFKDKNYFPLRVADQYMAKVREQQSGDRKLKNSGFTQAVTPNAKNPVVLSSFLEVWAEHVDEMSLYHSFVLPLDDLSRVLNYHDAYTEETAAGSVMEAIKTAYGEAAVNYIDNLIRDVNGGNRSDSAANFVNKWMSKAKKAQTMASLSVAIQQPSSILRAMSMINSSYFFGAKVTEKTHDRTWDEIKEYAPIAIIKEMGGYDTHVGKNTVDYLTDSTDYHGFGEKFKAFFTDGDFRDDAFGKLPELMDEMAWGVIWNAVKREQATKHPDVDVKSKAFMSLVADRFTDVITHTQVYDSVFSRSGLMRSKDGLVKMGTSFMAEPTTTANMLAMAVIQAKRGEISKAQAGRTVAAIAASLALNAALVSVVYALRDDDEDKRYDEKWLENFRNNFFESLNPAGYIPFIRDIDSMRKGFDIERTDMTLIGDLMNAIQGLENEDVTAWDKTLTVIGAVGDVLGVPMKNIIRDVRGIVQTAGFAWDDKPNPRTKTGAYMARRGMDLNNGEEMILALQRGDMEHIQRVFGRYESQEKAESALQSAIGEKYRAGEMSAEEATQLLTDYFEREEFEVYWLLDKWDHAIENGNTDSYTKMGAFLDAIENGGDYVAEMQRYLEHGSEMSDLRSAISSEYKKLYLAADDADREEIRDKLTPVYLETDMYESEIQKKFNDWDFEAEYGYTYSDYKAAYRDGEITEQDLRGAMKFYGLKNFEIEETVRELKDDIAFRKKFDMTLSELKDAYDNGDVSRNTLINALVYTGMTKTQAQEEVNKRDISNRLGIDYMKLDDAYKAGDISRQTLYNSMIEAGTTKREADETIVAYDWLKQNYKKYPDLTISDAKKFVIKIGNNDEDHTLADYGVTIDHYIQYGKLKPECKGVDANGDGKTDDGTLRDSIFRMIDSLPISDSEKDGLALISYGIKSIRRNAPWHKK